MAAIPTRPRTIVNGGRCASTKSLKTKNEPPHRMERVESNAHSAGPIRCIRVMHAACPEYVGGRTLNLAVKSARRAATSVPKTVVCGALERIVKRLRFAAPEQNRPRRPPRLSRVQSDVANRRL